MGFNWFFFAPGRRRPLGTIANLLYCYCPVCIILGRETRVSQLAVNGYSATCEHNDVFCRCCGYPYTQTGQSICLCHTGQKGILDYHAIREENERRRAQQEADAEEEFEDGGEHEDQDETRINEEYDPFDGQKSYEETEGSSVEGKTPDDVDYEDAQVFSDDDES